MPDLMGMTLYDVQRVHRQQSWLAVYDAATIRKAARFSIDSHYQRDAKARKVILDVFWVLTYNKLRQFITQEVNNHDL